MRDEVMKKRGGWFARHPDDDLTWSGPWKTQSAALAARRGEWAEARRLETED